MTLFWLYQLSGPLGWDGKAWGRERHGACAGGGQVKLQLSLGHVKFEMTFRPRSVDVRGLSDIEHRGKPTLTGVAVDSEISG